MLRMNTKLSLVQKIKYLKVPYFMPPEVLEEKEATFASDIFAFGIIMWELYSEQPLFDNRQDFLSFAHDVIAKQLRPISNDELEKLSATSKCPFGNGDMDDKKKNFLKLVRQCWTQDPSDRVSIEFAINHLKECSSKTSAISKQNASVAAIQANAEQVNSRYEKIKLVQLHCNLQFIAGTWWTSICIFGQGHDKQSAICIEKVFFL